MLQTVLEDLAMNMAVPRSAGEMPHCMSFIRQGKVSVAGELALL